MQLLLNEDALFPDLVEGRIARDALNALLLINIDLVCFVKERIYPYQV